MAFRGPEGPRIDLKTLAYALIAAGGASVIGSVNLLNSGEDMFTGLAASSFLIGALMIVAGIGIWVHTR